MAIDKDKFFEIINEVSESRNLDEDNLLERIKNELKGKDAGEYNKFSKNFSKEHQFSIKISEEAAEDWKLLHLATACNNMLIVELLLKKKASVNARVKDGSKNDGLTALHIATSCGHESMVKQLLSNDRVNPSLKSKNKTPREVVSNTENKEAIVQMLEEAEQNFYTKHEKKTDTSADVINSVEQYNTIRSGKQTPITCGSSDSIVSEQYLHAGVKNMVEKFESTQRGSVTYSGKQTPIGESVSSDDNGLALKTTFDTSSYSEINQEGAANEVDDQTLESLQTQVQLEDSQIRKLEKPGKELKHVEKELEKLKSDVAGHKTRLEILYKLSEENKSLKQQIQDLTLKQQIQDLKSKNTTLNSELEKIKGQHSNDLNEHKIKLEELSKLNKENQSLKQKIKDLENENTTLNSELSKTKANLKIASELKEVSIQCSMQHDACKT